MKVISYSIFGYSGRNGNYWAYLPSLIRAHSLLFPDYKIALYHDDCLYNLKYGEVLQELNKEDILDLHDMGKKQELCKSMLWRCKAIWDYPKAKVVFFRDIDSCPTYPERCANESFISSKFVVHGINSVPAHSVPIMGGLWGCKSAKFRTLTRIPTWKHFALKQMHFKLNIHGSDQLFLASNILPKVQYHLLVHKAPMPSMDFPEIGEDIREKSKQFAPFPGSAGYARRFTIEYCNSLNTSFINRLNLIEKQCGIEDIISHKHLRIE